MTLGEKIQRLRKETGLSQEALAEKINVTRQTVSKWECNQSSPDLDFIAQLSDIFNVSADYLIQAEISFVRQRQAQSAAARFCRSIAGFLYLYAL